MVDSVDDLFQKLDHWSCITQTNSKKTIKRFRTSSLLLFIWVAIHLRVARPFLEYEGQATTQWYVSFYLQPCLSSYAQIKTFIFCLAIKDFSKFPFIIHAV